METLIGSHVALRPATLADVEDLVRIRSTEAVSRWWRGDDVRADTVEAMGDDEREFLAIDLDGQIIGAIQWAEEEDPEYHHANIDLYLDPAFHRRGLGFDAITTVIRHLFDDLGHHRITIDPAADNTAAIAAYTKVGFRTVGVMHQYELGSDGTWHDGLLMELLADDYRRPGPPDRP